jgi:hypothetical protein
MICSLRPLAGHVEPVFEALTQRAQIHFFVLRLEQDEQLTVGQAADRAGASVSHFVGCPQGIQQAMSLS